MPLYYKNRELVTVDTGKRKSDPSLGLTDDDNRNNEANLSKIIEALRKQLVELVKEKGLSDSEVVVLSQHLDEYIVQFQVRMSTKSSK
ncbi:aspartyl-phosphate phosphatase Spo0E family protein [Brevibacillus borstelensis]|uniref:aspartyl-phosphate phosphatase Spo0E family protein n=1 Tax=Brevibacillus borstelensis TaxID=45462 RepID=UPI0030C35E5E